MELGPNLQGITSFSHLPLSRKMAGSSTKPTLPSWMHSRQERQQLEVESGQPNKRQRQSAQAAPASGSGPTRGANSASVKPLGDAEVQDSINLLFKMSLSSQLQHRETAAILQQTFLVAAEHPVVLATEKAGKKYAEQAKAQPGESHGPPHLHKAYAFLEEMTNIDLTQPLLNQVLAMMQAFQSQEVAHGFLPLFKVKPCYAKRTGPSKVKVTFSAVNSEHKETIKLETSGAMEQEEEISFNPFKVLKGCLNVMEGEFKLGMAPAGAMERAAQALLDKQQGK